jgi:hypothetical protein
MNSGIGTRMKPQSNLKIVIPSGARDLQFADKMQIPRSLRMTSQIIEDDL